MNDDTAVARIDADDATYSELGIEIRREAGGREDPDYEGFEINDKRLARGTHRRFVGGHWDEMGRLQLDFLVSQGLRPEHRFLDVGCGSLRAGRWLVDHLDPGNYHGIDINVSLVETGYRHELTDAQRDRLPVSNLRVTDRFDSVFDQPFDMAIAQSVFTHVSLNQIRLCLYRVAQAMRPGGTFYATFFEKDADYPLDLVREGGKMFTERNLYWYYRDDLRWAAERSPWSFRYIGGWDHPRGQKMVEFTRLPD